MLKIREDWGCKTSGDKAKRIAPYGMKYPARPLSWSVNENVASPLRVFTKGAYPADWEAAAMKIRLSV